MQTYAHIRDGIVVEIIEPLELDMPQYTPAENDGEPPAVVMVKCEVPIEERYHPDFVAQCVNVTGLDPMPQAGDAYVDGKFVPPAPVVESADEIRARALIEIRAQRAPILFTLDGMASRAFRAGDNATVALCDGAIDDLKAITAWPDFLAATTYDDMKAAILGRYREIAWALPDSLQIAFREVLG